MIFQFHTHRIIEVEADSEEAAVKLLEAELHDDESVLSMTLMEDRDA